MANSVKKIPNFGVLMYGQWKYFDTLKEAVYWCVEGMAGCEGSERERFVEALLGFADGWTHINTDH